MNRTFRISEAELRQRGDCRFPTFKGEIAATCRWVNVDGKLSGDIAENARQMFTASLLAGASFAQ
jgi:hypothetical protein